HIEEAAAVGLDHHFAWGPADIDGGDDRRLHRVVVERVARGRLVVPDAFAGLRPDRHDRVGEQVVPLAGARVPGRGVADAPINQAELGVVGPGHPGAAAAGERRIAFPGLGAGLALGRDRPHPPEVLAGLGVVAFEQAAVAELGAGNAHDHDAVDDERRAGHGVAVAMGDRVRRLDLPDRLAGLGVERDHAVVHQAANDHALVDAGAAIDDAAADDAQGLRRIFVLDP